jgi:predicted amidohydrolase YtcJ
MTTIFRSRITHPEKNNSATRNSALHNNTMPTNTTPTNTTPTNTTPTNTTPTNTTPTNVPVRHPTVIPSAARDLLSAAPPKSPTSRAVFSPTLRAVALAATLCATFASPGIHAQSRTIPEPPAHTTLYLHGRIYTNDPAHPWASAMSVRDGKITCIGEISTVMLECIVGPNPETVQLAGRFVMPGFNDAHVHLGGAAIDKLSVQLNGVTSIEELQKRLAATIAQHKEGDWITGAGWDHTLWPDKAFPTRQQLDAVSPKNPVFLTHISGHVAVANSLALRAAGVVKTTGDPAGGKIERDADGQATGMLLEDTAMHLVRVKIPDMTDDQLRQGLEMVFADVARNGITSVQDNSEWEFFSLYHKLKEEGNLTVRITEWLPFETPIGDLRNMRSEGGTTDPMLRTGLLKGFLDGALGSRTAALLAPYSDDPSTSGILTANIDDYRKLAIERDKAGFQIAFHAIGDKANRAALDIFEAVSKANGERDRRDRIEHAQVIAPEDLSRLASLKVIASMQPSHETTDMRWAEQRLGPERSKGAYAWSTLQKSGARLAFGTDYDVEILSPFRGLYACTTRELPEGGFGNGQVGGWQPQEKLPLEDCISAYTTGSAYAQFSEGKKGELKPGEYADFIVLSDDLTKIPPSQYTSTKVLRTVLSGRTVYQAPQ